MHVLSAHGSLCSQVDLHFFCTMEQRGYGVLSKITKITMLIMESMICQRKKGNRMHRHIRKLYTHPLYVIAFFVLVAGLSSSAAWLGDDGIFYVVFGAAIIVVVTPIALGKLAKQWKRTLSGSPSRLDYLAAPSGYRRARYAETEEEAIAQSIVVPTPNRPLLAEQRTQKSDSSVVTHLLDEDDAIQSSSNSPFLERKRLEFNPSQSTKLLDDPRSDALQSDPRFPKPQDF